MADLVRRVPSRRRGRARGRRPRAPRRSPSPAPGCAATSGEAAEATAEAVARAEDLGRPRAVIAAGPDSRLLRAVLEPWCPVPFVAWPAPGLPGLGRQPRPGRRARPRRRRHRHRLRRRRGRTPRLPGRRRLPADARMVAEHAAGRWSTILPTTTRDQLATAVVMLEYLDRVSLGPRADAEQVAEALDAVAIACSPHRDLAVNPAKMLAIALADANPVVWGGSVLAARAARRVAESIRRATRPHRAGRRRRAPAAGDRGGPAARRLRRPVRRRRGRAAADAAGPRRRRRGRRRARAARPAAGRRRRARGVRVETVTTDAPTEVARYASLLLSGTYAAEYLRIGFVED